MLCLLQGSERQQELTGRDQAAPPPPLLLPPLLLPLSGWTSHQAAWRRSFAAGTISVSSGSSRSSSSSTGGSTGGSSGTGSSERRPLVKRRGKLVPVLPEFAALLEPLAEQCGADANKIAAAAASLWKPRQEQLLHTGPTVATYLQRLGVEQRQLARLLQRCPLLFSRPAEQRTGVLFGQLMALGLSAAEAVHCFEKVPMAAASPSFEAAAEVLEDLFASCSKEGRGGQQQLLGDLLRKQPTAGNLLRRSAGTLREQIDYRLAELGFSRQQLVAGMWHDYTFLNCSSKFLAGIKAALI